MTRSPARSSGVGDEAGQEPVLDQDRDVPQRRVLGALGELGPFRRGELPLEAVQDTLQNAPLAFVESETRSHVIHYVTSVVSGSFVAPSADRDSPHPAASGREQGRVPVEQPLCNERVVEASGRIEHEFEDPLDIAIHRPDTVGNHAETPRSTSGPPPRRVSVTAPHHVLDQRFEPRLAPQTEAERLPAAQEATLPVPDVGQPIDARLGAPVEPRPVGPVRKCTFSARFAEISAAIHRMRSCHGVERPARVGLPAPGCARRSFARERAGSRRPASSCTTA